MHLVNLAPDPRILARKVDFVAEDLAYGRIGAQCVEGGADDRGLLLLVIEEDEDRDGKGDYEDGEGFKDLA